jgi:hypothetical protein
VFWFAKSEHTIQSGGVFGGASAGVFYSSVDYKRVISRLQEITYSLLQPSRKHQSGSGNAITPFSFSAIIECLHALVTTAE